MAEEKRSKGRGPGFILGAVVGAVAGAAAAILLSPPSQEGTVRGMTEAPATPASPPTPETPPAYMTTSEDESLIRVRAMLERVRARMREAGDAGRDAAQEQEQALNTRYAELTSREQAGPKTG